MPIIVSFSTTAAIPGVFFDASDILRSRQTHHLDEQRFHAYCSHLRDIYNFEPKTVDSFLKDMRVLAANSQYLIGAGTNKSPVNIAEDEPTRKPDGHLGITSASVGKTDHSRNRRNIAHGRESRDAGRIAEVLTHGRRTPRSAFLGASRDDRC